MSKISSSLYIIGSGVIGGCWYITRLSNWLSKFWIEGKWVIVKWHVRGRQRLQLHESDVFASCQFLLTWNPHLISRRIFWISTKDSFECSILQLASVWIGVEHITLRSKHSHVADIWLLTIEQFIWCNQILIPSSQCPVSNVCSHLHGLSPPSVVKSCILE